MKQIIETDQAPAAIGPYSQAVKVTCKTMIFCSGQIPLDPATGEIVGETAADQGRRAIENLKAVLKEAGADCSQVVKTTLYLADMGDFAAVNEVYAAVFSSSPPARAAVAVRDLPKGAKVMIDAIAVV